MSLRNANSSGNIQWLLFVIQRYPEQIFCVCVYCLTQLGVGASCVRHLRGCLPHVAGRMRVTNASASKKEYALFWVALACSVCVFGSGRARGCVSSSMLIV